MDAVRRGNSLSAVAAEETAGELPWMCEVEESEGGSCKASA